MPKYDFKKVEKKWQAVWEKEGVYRAKDGGGKKKYILVEFPYPSGEGLHMGHLRPYVAGDVMSRYSRMQGFEVMYPIGWDAFGLPAENFAIKRGIHPSITTASNIKNAKAQVKSWGISFDWSREVNTTDPGYYKWTQWIFLQFYKAGLAYESEGLINWCPKDKTGLANEEVVGGRCERCGTIVEQKVVRQWYLKITAYAEKLLKGLEKLDWPEEIKLQQKNWIGKSEGAEITFEVKAKNGRRPVTVFTTRPDTLFGATYLVLAPEHPLVSDAALAVTNHKEVADYAEKAKSKTEQDRAADNKEKTGVELKGITALNPATGKEIPVWVADYVLGGYGTGAIMAVPAHDERDRAFALKHRLPIVPVIEPVTGTPHGDEHEKEAIVAILRDPKRGKTLMLNWGPRHSNYGGKLFIGGGVDGKEAIVEAALREIREETGYIDVKLMGQTEVPVNTYFYSNVKNRHTKARMWGFLFDLESEKQTDVRLEEGEKNKFKAEWVPDAEAAADDAGHALIYRMLTESAMYDGEGVLMNSGKWNGLTTGEARKAVAREFGAIKVQYHLRDWVFSRQRYWGEPIPLIHCPDCGVVPVPEKDLPVKLPVVKKYEPTGTGESPLAAVTKWVKTKCPKCKGPAKRETNTMPQWAGSSWYYLRYADPRNKKQFASRSLLKRWLPVDRYFGGMEHTTLHLLYSRFWHLFLYDKKLVPTREPYAERVPHGIILGPDGEKMSKSRGNVVNPDEIVKRFGADTLRMYEMFLGPHGATVGWNDGGILGIVRFLERAGRALQNAPVKKAEKSVLQSLHRTVKKVGEDIEGVRFNTAISALMIFLNETEAKPWDAEVRESFAKLLAPFAPHLAEEFWRTVLKNKKSIHRAPWPKFSASLVKADTFTLVIQVNGKVRGSVEAATGLSESAARDLALQDSRVKEFIAGKEPRRVIYVPGRLVNIVV
jgi:leucyl-tRNA synthetase